MGCGAYGCPPTLVAQIMRDILLEPEFSGWFKRVAFACYSKSPYERKPTNFVTFTEAFQDVTLNQPSGTQGGAVAASGTADIAE